MTAAGVIPSGERPPVMARTELGWRVSVSVVTVFALASFLVLHFAFWSDRLTAVQNIALVIVALMAFIATNGATWASWGIRFAPRPLS